MFFFMWIVISVHEIKHTILKPVSDTQIANNIAFLQLCWRDSVFIDLPVWTVWPVWTGHVSCEPTVDDPPATNPRLGSTSFIDFVRSILFLWFGFIVEGCHIEFAWTHQGCHEHIYIYIYIYIYIKFAAISHAFGKLHHAKHLLIGKVHKKFK